MTYGEIHIVLLPKMLFFHMRNYKGESFNCSVATLSTTMLHL